MNVKDLIAQLQTLDPELDVFISSDSEGNEFKPVSDNPFFTFYHDGEEEFCSPEDYQEEYDEEVKENVVVLFPIW